MTSIKMSEKHGVNPAIPICFFCLEEKNEIVLPGRMRGDVEAPKNAIWNTEPCDHCIGLMKQGVIIISIDEEKSRLVDNGVYRTGGMAVVKDSAIKETFASKELVKTAIERRYLFVPNAVWKGLGLPPLPPQEGNSEPE